MSIVRKRLSLVILCLVVSAPVLYRFTNRLLISDYPNTHRWDGYQVKPTRVRGRLHDGPFVSVGNIAFSFHLLHDAHVISRSVSHAEDAIKYGILWDEFAMITNTGGLNISYDELIHVISTEPIGILKKLIVKRRAFLQTCHALVEKAALPDIERGVINYSNDKVRAIVLMGSTSNGCIRTCLIYSKEGNFIGSLDLLYPPSVRKTFGMKQIGKVLDHIRISDPSDKALTDVLEYADVVDISWSAFMARLETRAWRVSFPICF